ncbi:hypothetical protein CQW23_18501 [Capsicum baccatum]|uniref:Uncharacterized protein n=1 Tax=Capsicum baccatum TaxID=33114 RepID=A0A2G2W327_CAPBA|nr:hypothetical protein CQW23_18501 [Capsicum baccatum]
MVDTYTIVEPITNNDGLEAPLPAPRKLDALSFSDIKLQHPGVDFDLLAVVANCSVIQYTADQSKHFWCHFELNITDASGTITASISEALGERLLSNKYMSVLRSSNNRLSVVHTNHQLAHKLFKLQLQKSVFKFTDQKPDILALASFTEAESPVRAIAPLPTTLREAGVQIGGKRSKYPFKNGLKSLIRSGDDLGDSLSVHPVVLDQNLNFLPRLRRFRRRSVGPDCRTWPEDGFTALVAMAWATVRR